MINTLLCNLTSTSMYDIVFNNGGNSEHDVKMYFEISTFLEKFSFKMKACVIHG